MLFALHTLIVISFPTHTHKRPYNVCTHRKQHMSSFAKKYYRKSWPQNLKLKTSDQMCLWQDPNGIEPTSPSRQSDLCFDLPRRAMWMDLESCWLHKAQDLCAATAQTWKDWILDFRKAHKYFWKDWYMSNFVKKIWPKLKSIFYN